MMKKLTFILLFYTCSLAAFAQQYETTLPTLRGLYQSSFTNPAFSPEYKVSIGLPGLNNLGLLQFNLSGLDVHTIASSVKSDTMFIPSLYNKLNGPVGFNIPVSTDIIYFRFPIKKIYFGFHSTLKVDQSYTISKEFLGFLSMGNDYFIGKNQDYELMRLKLTAYVENGISISREFKRFSIGGRVKYLKGLANMQTSNIKMNLNTSSTLPYPITLSMSGTIQAAGIPLPGTVDSINGQKVNSSDTGTYSTKILQQSGNDGWGLDLGFVYQISTKFSMHASVIDLGSKITWTNKVFNVKLDPSTINFGGFNYDQSTNKNGARDSLLNDIKNKIGKATITRDKYVTYIPTRYYGGLDFEPTLRDRFSFLFQGIEYLGTFNTAYTLGYMRRIGKNGQITGNYSVRSFGPNDFGVGAVTKLGPLQFYFMTDNIMSFAKPTYARTFAFRLGINLVFGRVARVKKLFI